ncbi:MAG: M28 family metallopeptidase [Woeseiaceae bacterium]
MRTIILRCGLAIVTLAFTVAANADEDASRLVAAMLGDTPVIEDLRELTDTIGGRVTGTDSNRDAVIWAVGKLREAEVAVTTEDFQMPAFWDESYVAASVSGDTEFRLDAIAKPYSVGATEMTATLIDAGFGTAADFDRLGDAAAGAWAVVETPVLDDNVGLGGLFGLYGDAYRVETNAAAAGVAGIVTMSPYPKNLVYRQFASQGPDNSMPLLVAAREDAKRTLRLLRSGENLSLTTTIGVNQQADITSTNVIAEIPGKSRPEEVVLFGAHIDSHDLGTGALDNGVNVVMLINIARQMTRLGLQPERTIRFALWNGEEQGLVGSWKYTEQHVDELDNHVVAASFDIGSGRTSGFFTGGHAELGAMVDKYLLPVAALGPFGHAPVPVVGTDNYDFMMQGVPNLIAIQSDANYASNYHAESDTFDKVDQNQMRLNSAITAAVIWGFANDSGRLPRHSRAEIEAMIESTDLEQQMRNFAVWDDWVENSRGRND